MIHLCHPRQITLISKSTQPVTNETAWNICHGNDIRWLFCESSNALSTNYVWDSANLIFNYTEIAKILATNNNDYWQYWRVRADQGHRIGHYSPDSKIPDFI